MIDWQAFHFIRPEWLIALLPLLLVLLALRYVSFRQSGWQGVLSAHLYKHLIRATASSAARPPLALIGIAWTIATLALAGPTWERLPQPVYQLEAGKVIVMDMSMSMRATDVTPDRLTRARFKAIDLLNSMREGDTGLVAYAGDAFTISPLTSDVKNLTALIPSLRPEIMPVAGSDPYSGLLTAIELLRSAGYQQGDLIWITDGVEFAQIDELVELINDSPYTLSILAIGTAQGAPIRLLDGDLLKDASGAIVVPKLNMSMLSGLASRTGGRAVALQSDDSDIDYLLERDRRGEDVKESGDDEQQPVGDEWKEMGPYLVLLLLPLAAYAFRRGLLACFILTCLLPLSSPPVSAAQWWDELWKTGDQRGISSFEQGNFDHAARQFDDPLWQGSAHYRAGNYEQALEAFSQVQNADGLYNQGNALAKLGQYEQAIAAYDQALALDPGHEDAQANKELLEQLKQQQDEQQQQDQQNQQQQDQQQGQDQQEQQQNNNQQSENGEQSQSQQQDPSQQNQSQQNQQQGQQQEQQSDAEQAEQQQQDDAEMQQQESPQSAAEQELTDEQREQMQRMQNLLRKVPDDPAYLLQRKMQLEYQQRQRERLPTQLRKDW
ncbi:vWA domain-containing protein [Aestuariibacter salexigens]|uniref:vWA domain-containing protein n=1 Tax=Aestuariibacter salexigens TaxID=226010 RepID=UPI0004137AD8|nr:tetratricopeptide repeat protein [Aestuariibacter salexigens]